MPLLRQVNNPETFQEAEHTYSTLGTGPNIEMFEADDGHGYSHRGEWPPIAGSHQFWDKDDTAAEYP